MQDRPTARFRAAALVLIAALLLPGSGVAEGPLQEKPAGPNPAVMAFDVVLLRPLGFVALVVGVGAFIPATIITAPNGLDSVQSAMEIFVIEPGKAVFQRPLGRF